MQLFKFLSKGKNLLQLRGRVKTAQILPVFLVNQKALLDLDSLRKRVIQEFGPQHQKVIIRSSFSSEDNKNSSAAGKFLSLANISLDEPRGFEEAVMAVSASWDQSGEFEILIQPMFFDAKRSGVVLSADYETGAPYISVNYDESGSLNSITSGSGNFQTIQFLPSNREFHPAWITQIFLLVQELRELYGEKFLDLEFAFDQSDSLWLLQVRPMVGVREKVRSEDFIARVESLYHSCERAFKPNPNLLGDGAVYGVMPDWNPAEMIGIRPKPLALSLYKELITDSVWAYQRNNYGYRNLRSCPLMVHLGGIPFIDVKASFNSFIPKDLPEKIAEKLVNYYLKRLVTQPYLHDKVEFEIVHSCYYFNLDDRLKPLMNSGFNQNELKRIEFTLLELTNQVLDSERGLCRKDLQKITSLQVLHQQVLKTDTDWISKVFWLVEYCKRYGTLPFAGIARAAFIAIQLLRSLVDVKVLSSSEYDSFLNSLNTVSRRLSQDLQRHLSGEISKENFLSLYGHLRPGTYDIFSPRYDEAYDEYFKNASIQMEKETRMTFVLSDQITDEVARMLIEGGLKCSPQELFDFARIAIEGREYAKFVFTKTLSEVLSLIKQNAPDHFKIEMRDLPYLDIQYILSQYASFEAQTQPEGLLSKIHHRQEEYLFTEAFKLPSILCSREELFCFSVYAEEPNFISNKSIQAQTVLEQDISQNHAEGKIVLIRSADPGYDYLFSKNIGGLITQYGGANSHMAIRCAELGIPAVIGAGESRFESWSKSSSLYLDCLNRQVKIIA